MNFGSRMSSHCRLTHRDKQKIEALKSPECVVTEEE